MAGLAKNLILNNGAECPRVGLGSYLAKDPAEIARSVKSAIELGYRHIDTAEAYQNEAEIGKTLKPFFDSGSLKRSELFLTTKIFPANFANVVATLKRQLADLQLSYIDLYLMHAPAAFHVDPEKGIVCDLHLTPEKVWADMEECVKLGLTKAIGISNFNIGQVQRILNVATIKPAMNQIESHPYLSNAELIDFCHANKVDITAYAPLGSPGNGITRLTDKSVFTDERLTAIAKKHGKSNAQVAIRWQVQRGNVVIPKSVSPERVKQNFDIWDFELDDGDMAAIMAMNENVRFCVPDSMDALKNHPEWPF